MQTIEEALEKLDKSEFRSRFRLKDADVRYIREKGLSRIEEHAYNLIGSRLAPAYPFNDGAQTPMKGHPVFIAQHATATCCRGCLEKWYKIPRGKDLSEEAQRRIVNLIMAWIMRDLNRYDEQKKAEKAKKPISPGQYVHPGDEIMWK